MTTTMTDNGQIVIKKAHLSLWHIHIDIYHKITHLLCHTKKFWQILIHLYNPFIFASQASYTLTSSLLWLVQFEYHSPLSVDKNYRAFIMVINRGYSVEKIMFMYKIPKILNSMMSFKQQFAVNSLKYNRDTTFILFSCCLLSAI